MNQWKVYLMQSSLNGAPIGKATVSVYAWDCLHAAALAVAAITLVKGIPEDWWVLAATPVEPTTDSIRALH